MIDKETGLSERLDRVEQRDFPTADILTVTTGRVLSSRRMDGMCELVEWLTREKPFPRMLNEADRRRLLTSAARARDLLIWQHPWLIDTQPPADIDNSDLLDWLISVEKRHGEMLIVVRQSPLAGLAAAMDRERQALIELGAKIGSCRGPR